MGAQQQAPWSSGVQGRITPDPLPVRIPSAVPKYRGIDISVFCCGCFGRPVSRGFSHVLLVDFIWWKPVFLGGGRGASNLCSRKAG